MFPRMDFWAGTQGMAATWPPWGVGRGPRTSWIARCKAQPAGRVWPTAAVAAGLVHAAMDAGEEPRRGRGEGDTGDVITMNA